MYKYIGYGQKIESDSVFPQFVPADFEDEADIIIHHYVEDEIKKELTDEYQLSLKDGDIYYKNQVGYFESRQGREIFYEEHPGQDENEAKEFVMGNTFALLFYERGMNVIHGAAVRFGDKTIIISGDSGAGKSTTTSMLIREGARLITDDQSIVFLENGEVKLLPGYPAQKLCEDAAGRNSYDVKNLIKIDEQKNKYAIPRQENFFGEISKVDALIYLRKHAEGETIVASQVLGAEKANVLTKNLFLKPFFTQTQMMPQSMMLQCLQIAGKIDIFEISRKKNVDTENEIKACIGKMLDNEETFL